MSFSTLGMDVESKEVHEIPVIDEHPSGSAVLNSVPDELIPELSEKSIDLSSSVNSQGSPHSRKNGSVVNGSKKNQSKRRSSLVSQNPRPKVHKRKQNWETRKASVTYLDNTKKGFNLAMLRAFILDVIRSKSFASNDVFKAELYGKVKNMTVVFVSGLLSSDLNVSAISDKEHVFHLERPLKTSLPMIYDKFQHVIPMSLPANKESMISPMTVLLKIPLTNKQKKKREADNKELKLVLYDLLLTETEMRDNNYPIHSLIDSSEGNSLPNGWVETTPFEHSGSHVFAVDCEFCDAASGKVLTRVSIVNFQNEVIYDSFVKPDEEITNYQTRYSGITENTLREVTTTIDFVQKKLLSIISSTDILIGHSLESDLNVLHLRHPRVIDSALTYEHHKGFPQKPGLRWLADQYLGRSIQNGEKDGTGHSSVEDLIASLDLIKLKLMSGADFGRNLEELIFAEGTRASAKFRARIIDYGVSLYNNICKDNDFVDICSISNDSEALSTFESKTSKYFFNLVWFRDLKKYQQSQNQSKDTKENETSTSTLDTKSEETSFREKILTETNDRLQRVYDSLASGSILVVCSDGGETEDIFQLQKIRREFQKQLRAGVEVNEITGEVWDTQKQDLLHLAVSEARKAFAMIAIKE